LFQWLAMERHPGATHHYDVGAVFFLPADL